MPSVPEVIALRHKRRSQVAHRPSARLGRLGMGCGLLASLAIALQLLGLAVAYATLTADLPPVEKIPALIEPPGGLAFRPTRLYDRSGEHLLMSLESGAADTRRYRSLETSGAAGIPEILIQATLAAADPGFWEHSGFSWQGILEGTHPTLAQRLVNDFLLWDEPPGLRHALRERLLAAQLTARFGRPKILEWYLNSADYGQYAFGADAAARAYFGKPAGALRLAEAAALAALAEQPVLNPEAAPEIIRENKNKILQAMAQQGYIDRRQLDAARADHPVFRTEEPLSGNEAAAFNRLVLSQLGNYLDIERLSRGGFDVITTLDYDLQTQAGCASAIQLARLSGPAPRVDGSAVAECQAARLLTTFPAEEEVAGQEVAAGAVILDPATAQVLALTATSPDGGQLDHLPVRPPGSILAPFVYLTAFSRGMGPASLLWDIPADEEAGIGGGIPVSRSEGQFIYENPDGKYHGPVRVRTALANDYLLSAVQVFSEMGAQQVWQTAGQLGLDELIFPKAEASSSMLFGGGGANLLDLAQAFGSIANQGVLVGLGARGERLEDTGEPLQPQFILKVSDKEGNLWLDCQATIAACHPTSRSVISPQLAYLLNHILSDETSRWPSLGHPNPLEVGRPAAAKIGQTQPGTDAWTLGYTPELVVGTWIGSQLARVHSEAVVNLLDDTPRKTSPETANEKSIHISPKWAAGLWHALLQYAVAERPIEAWPAPPGISEVQVCDPSGLLPTAQCPNLVKEIFLSGSEPTHSDDLYRSLRLNRETGRLATLTTRPELIEDKVFLVVPAQAAKWAQEAGIPPPPQAYDTINAVAMPDATVTLSSPAPFSVVGGRVTVQGSASGPDFDLYRLQVGQGLDPDHWLQIGEDHARPVENGELGVWDTSGLSGLYALQLLVMREDQSVQVASLQVSIDNEEPTVSIQFPGQGQRFLSSKTDALTFLVEASDDLGMASVAYWVDAELLEQRESAPFAATWETSPGRHILKVRAADRAGNWSEDQIEFYVDP